MEPIGTSQLSDRFKPAPADKDRNHWTGTPDLADAQEVIRDTWIEKHELRKPGRVGHIAYIVHMRVTSKDGVDHWYDLTMYSMNLKEATQMTKTLRGLARQIKSDQLDRWFDGAHFQKANLPGGDENMIGLLRFDPLTNEWMAVSSKDRWGIQPTLSKIEPGTFRYWTFRLDELVETGGYNCGSGDGPWNKWPTWKATKPIWESELASNIRDPDDLDGAVAKFALRYGKKGLTYVDWTSNTTQRISSIRYATFADTLGNVQQTWQGGEHAKAVGKIAAAPFEVTYEGLKKTGQIAGWGALKLTIPISNIANYYTRGSAKAYMGKISAYFGVYLYTHDHDNEKIEKVTEELFKLQEEDPEAYKILFEGWKKDKGVLMVHPVALVFNEDND